MRPICRGARFVVEERTRRRDQGYRIPLKWRKGAEETGHTAAEATLLHGVHPHSERERSRVGSAARGNDALFPEPDVPASSGRWDRAGSARREHSTFALGRRSAEPASDAMGLVRLDGEVPTRFSRRSGRSARLAKRGSFAYRTKQIALFASAWPRQPSYNRLEFQKRKTGKAGGALPVLGPG